MKSKKGYLLDMAKKLINSINKIEFTHDIRFKENSNDDGCINSIGFFIPKPTK